VTPAPRAILVETSTDCTTFALMVRLDMSTALAFDIHFRQYGRLVVLP
jgi:predicted nucleic acid-binding protein